MTAFGTMARTLAMAAALTLAQASADAQANSGLPQDSPEGHYVVLVYAAWAQTTPQGEFHLEPGGVYRDVWHEHTGRYTYDRRTRVVKFLDGPYVEATVEFDPTLHGRGALKITWPGIDPIWAYREPPAGGSNPPAAAPAPAPKSTPGARGSTAALEGVKEKWRAASTPGEQASVMMELSRIMAADPNDAEPMLVAGQFYFDLEDYKLAEAQAVAILGLDYPVPVQREAHRLLGLTYEATDRIDDAIDAYRKSVSLTPAGTPERAEALVYLGIALSGADKYAAAETVLREAVTADPANSTAHGELGSALAYQGRNREAAESYRRAIALNPDDDGAKGNLKIVQERLNGGGQN